MSSVEDGPPVEEARPQLPKIVSTTNNMKFPRVLRRSSTTESNEKQKEKDARRISASEAERKPSLSTLPLRLRRRRTQPTTIEHIAEESAPDTSKLGDLLFSLPSEILTEILTHLDLQTILTLRLTSQSFLTLLDYNASTLTRTLLTTYLDPITPNQTLYPTSSTTQSLHHLLLTLRRSINTACQIRTLLSFVQMKIYMTRTSARVLSVSDNRQRLIAAFHRPAWHLTHFLERYRSIVLHQHPTHTGSPNCSSCPTCKTLARDVVATYAAEDIMPTYHFFQLSLQHLQIATRAPAAAGTLERKLRGWGKSLVTEEMLGIFVILGGVQEIRKVAMMQGSYGSRSGFVLDFVEKVRDAVNVNEILRGKGRAARDVDEAWASAGEDGDGDGVANRDRQRGKGRRESESHRGGLMDSLSPPFHLLTQDHISSLPDVSRFFYDIWKERVHECALDRGDITEPYPWLQRVMSGSGVEFSQSRYADVSYALGASPV